VHTQPLVKLFPVYFNETNTTLIEAQKVWAEKWNGRLAMLGLVAAAASDILTGHMFFGIF